MPTRPSPPRLPTRRQALLAAGGLGSLGAAAAGLHSSFQAAAQGSEPVAIAGPVCRLTPEAVDGPYYFDPASERADIREDRAGRPMRFELQVIAAASCRPLQGARVDLWHADARGLYSGYRDQGDDRIDTTGRKFLRGSQFTDAAGAVVFQSIYPGWYQGRTTHAHFKVFLDRRSMATGQLYFPDALNDFLYSNVAPYKDRAARAWQTNARDGIFNQSGGAWTTAAVHESDQGYVARLTLAVAT